MNTKALALAFGAVIMLMVTLGIGGGIVAAQATDTPTPTLGFDETPWPRATPTPWELVEQPGMDVIDMDAETNAPLLADNIIQAYNFLNSSGFIDTAVFIAVTLFIVGLLTRIIRSRGDV